jgi:hypothetical protein
MTVSKDLPKYLTVADWTAKKKIPTKISGNTGIGAALTKLKLEWDKVDWDALDPNVALQKINESGEITHTAIDKAAPAIKPNLAKVPAVQKQLKTVIALIKTTETKWKANKLIPTASVKHVTAMKLAAEKIDGTLDDLDQAVDQHWAVVRQMADLRAGQKLKSLQTQFRGHLANLRNVAPIVLQEEDAVKAYRVFPMARKMPSVHQLVNALHNLLKAAPEPQWAAARQQFAAMAADSFLPKTEQEVDQKLRQVLRAADALEQTL